MRLRLHPEGGDSIDVRPVDIQGRRVLSFTTHESRRDTTVNHPEAQGIAEACALAARPGAAWLETTADNWQLVVPARGRPRIVRHKAKGGGERTPATHDRPKESALGSGARGWMKELGLADASGRPLPGRRDKVRQIERFADVLSHLVSSCGWREGDRVRVADMGCGNGYLTFAAWHLLRVKLRLDAEVNGVDAREDVIATCRRAAEAIRAGGLSFSTGSIENAPLTGVDALVALHACNDATDHAIRKGVESGAKLIVVAPCCHKEVRRALGGPDPVAPLLEYGLFKEHFSEWLTDGLRALALEAAGYRVTVAEFVSPDHTPKNTLIAGVRGNSEEDRFSARDRYARLKSWAGIAALPLDPVVAGSGSV